MVKPPVPGLSALVLVYTSSVSYGLQFMKWALNRISVGCSHSLGNTIALANHLSRIGQICRSNAGCGWLGVHVSLLVLCRTPSFNKYNSHRVKALCRHRLDLSTLNELCRCCVSNSAFLSICGGQSSRICDFF